MDNNILKLARNNIEQEQIKMTLRNIILTNEIKYLKEKIEELENKRCCHKVICSNCGSTTIWYDRID